jgi:hypothetical protein
LRASDGKLLRVFNAECGSAGVAVGGANIWVARGSRGSKDNLLKF